MHLLTVLIAMVAAIWLGKLSFEQTHEDTASYIKRIVMDDADTLNSRRVEEVEKELSTLRRVVASLEEKVSAGEIISEEVHGEIRRILRLLRPQEEIPGAAKPEAK